MYLPLPKMTQKHSPDAIWCHITSQNFCTLSVGCKMAYFKQFEGQARMDSVSFNLAFLFVEWRRMDQEFGIRTLQIWNPSLLCNTATYTVVYWPSAIVGKNTQWNDDKVCRQGKCSMQYLNDCVYSTTTYMHMYLWSWLPWRGGKLHGYMWSQNHPRTWRISIIW